MNEKQRILTGLGEEFDAWEKLLAGLSERQITTPDLPANLSVKDVVAHLMAWQQVSIARVRAAQLDREPVFPGWVVGSDPDAEDVDQVNARIYNAYHADSWASVYAAWREGFRRLLELAQAVPEAQLSDKAKYPWLHGYALLDVLQGSYEHHHIEHLEPLAAWLSEHRT